MFTRWKRAQRPNPGETASDDIAALLKDADAARERGDRASAISRYLAVLQRAPADLYSLFWLAQLHTETGDLRAAQAFCERGLALDPAQVGLLFALGKVASSNGDPAGALKAYERIRRIDPAADGLDELMADQYCFLGRTREGIAAFERALARNPHSIALQSNLLFVLNYSSDYTAEQVFERHREWGATHEARLRDTRHRSDNSRDPDRRLRIGYVSPDLRAHAVAFFAEPLLRRHDKASYDVHCFDTSPYPEDEVTRRLQAYGSTWHRVGKLSDEELARAIRECGVDVLIDLSGHSTLHRLLAFARRPAPVQATWLGYLNTTGLSAMDYRITDDYLDPAGATEQLHTEKLVRIPNASCFQPPAGAPPVGPLPALRSAAFKFGSVNQWAKVTDPTKEAWARILHAVPAAQLVIVARGGQNKEFRDAIIAEFTTRGARPDQIAVQPSLSLSDFLELFNQLDATLDPFPYGGGTTTMHSLWMGVPVVTLAGRTAFSRNSIGPLSEAGLGHLVADSPERYVEIAIGLTSTLDWLAQTRSSLRARMQASPLVDEVAFARRMERAYRAMWRSFCSGDALDPRIADMPAPTP